MEIIKEIARAFLIDFSVEFIRYFLAAGSVYLFVWILFKKSLLHRLIQKKFPPNSQLRREFVYSLSSMAIFAAVGVAMIFAVKKGYGKMYVDIEERGIPYFVGSVILAILMHDTYFYWTHRLMHHRALFRRVHLIHHLSSNPSPWAAYAFHPYEAIIQAMIGPIIIFCIPIHVGALTLFAIYQITYNVLGHSGFELLPKGFTRSKWFFWHNTSTHHNMHHRYFHSNYSIYYNWWDRWMGTLHPEYDKHYDEVTNRKKTHQNTDKSGQHFVLPES